MPITQVSGQAVGQQRGGISSAALTLTYPAATTVNDLLSLVLSYEGASSVTVSDSKSNTWHKAVTSIGSAGIHSEIWYAVASSAGSSHSVTVTPNVSTYLSATIDEFTSTSLTPLDQTATASGSSSTFNSGSVTTSTDGELYIAACDCDSSNGSLSSSGSGWTGVYVHPATTQQEGIGYAYQVGAHGTYSDTFASGAGVPFAGCIASFLPSGTSVYTESVSDTLSLTQSAIANKEIAVRVSQSLSLTDSVTSNFKVVRVSQTLPLVQSVDKRGPVYVDVRQTLPLLQHPASGGQKNLSASNTLALVDRANRTIKIAVSQSLSLTQTGERATKVHDVLNLVQTVSAGRGFDIADVLDLVQRAAVNLLVHGDVADVLALHQSVNYYLIKSGYRCSYSPFIGASTDATYPTPSPTPPTLGTATLTLSWPVTSPTLTVTLRNPTWGNRDRLAFSRVYRTTRGGDLIVFGDNSWPRQRTQLVTIEALTAAQFASLKSFLLASLGQQISWTDWYDRQWVGVCVNPDTALTQSGRGDRSVSLEMQGKLA